MDKNIDYNLRRKKILKWYEYVVTNPNEETVEAQPAVEEEIPVQEETAVSTKEPEISFNSEADFGDGSEMEDEIALKTSGLDEDDQALVLDIMARFAQAKQDNVDDLFSAKEEESEEELLSNICAPKQDNVDDLIRQAREKMNQ